MPLRFLSSLCICLASLSVTRILGLFAAGIIILCRGERRARLMGEEGGNIQRLLGTQAVALSQRHVVLDKGGCRLGARHAGADIERVVAPHGREGIAAIRRLQALTLGAVAGRTFFRVELAAVIGIGHE